MVTARGPGGQDAKAKRDDVPVAVIADTDDKPPESAPPESAPRAPRPPLTGFDPETVRHELLAYDPGAHAVARRAARERTLERRAAATDAGGAGVRGRDVPTHLLVVYSTARGRTGGCLFRASLGPHDVRPRGEGVISARASATPRDSFRRDIEPAAPQRRATAVNPSP